MITYETHHSSFTVQCARNMNFLLHMHQEIELIYITKGSLEVTIQHTPYTVNESDLALIMPHTLHGYHTPEYSEHILLIFKPDLITHYKPLMTSQCLMPIIRGDKLHPEIITYLNQLTLEENHSNIGLLKGYLYLLFTRLLPELEFVKAKYSPQDALIYHCLEYIHLHFKEPITLDILATHLGVNASYISRVFSKCIGYNFTYYLNTLRIDYAKYLLRETALPVTQISFECGYQTIRHFNRVFKDFTGYSPHNYQVLFNS